MGLRYLSILAGPTFKPTDVSGCVLWLDGKDPLNTGTPPSNGTAISTWSDKSGSGHDFAQGTSARQPTYTTSAVNSNGAVRFTRSGNNYLTYGSSFMTSGAAFDFFFMLYPVAISTSSYFYWNDHNTANAPVFNLSQNHIDFIANTGTWANGQYNTTIAANTAYGVEYQYNGSGSTTNGNFTVLLNGSTLSRSGASAGSGSSSATALGSDIVDSSIAFDGYVCEVVIYTNVISSANRTLLQNYFNSRWGAL